MTALSLVPHDSPILLGKAEKFRFDAPPFDPKKFTVDMVDTLRSRNAYGLAAPQVGCPYRVIAVCESPYLVAFNPIIVDAGGGTVDAEEGCLSYPNFIRKVDRHRWVKVRYTLPNGETVTQVREGMIARIWQHEVEHLDGLTLLTRETGVSRMMAEKKWAKVARRTGGRPIPVTGESRFADEYGGTTLEQGLGG